MRDRSSDRFIVFPFSVSCVSQSSVSISKPKKQHQSEAQRTQTKSRETNGKKPNISKLLKSFKSSLTHFIENLYKEEEEEEEEREMVIGYPTDVKHVTHVGVENLNSTKQQELPELLSLGCVSSLSVGQFEKAMEAQASAAAGECSSSLPLQHGQLGVVQV